MGNKAHTGGWGEEGGEKIVAKQKQANLKKKKKEKTKRKGKQRARDEKVETNDVALTGKARMRILLSFLSIALLFIMSNFPGWTTDYLFLSFVFFSLFPSFQKCSLPVAATVPHRVHIDTS